MEAVYLACGTDMESPPLNLIRLAADLALELTPLRAVPAGALTLVAGRQGLELRPSPTERGLRVDFPTELGPGNRGHRNRNQPLTRALGRPRGWVLDATTGWGQDAFLLASLGYQVIGLERSRVVYALLEDGYQRAMHEPGFANTLGSRLRFEWSEARSWLERTASSFEVIYLDPMFPPKRKRSALPGKEVQLLRRLVGHDVDAASLAEFARERCEDRLVVKRPTYAEALLPAPMAQYGGKLIRYDVYRRLPSAPMHSTRRGVPDGGR